MMQVASWPGYGDHQNQFIELFLDSLMQAGCAVDSLASIDDLEGKTPHIIILHWIERLFSEINSRWDIPPKIQQFLKLLSDLPPHTKVVWLVHNLQPHDARPVQRLVWPIYSRLIAKQVDAALTLSPGTIDPVESRYPVLRQKPVSWMWHPAYPDACLSQSDIDVIKRRHNWSSTQTVLGYCGLIRPYKGVEELVATFKTTQATDLRLLVTGLVQSSPFEQRLRQEAQSDPRIELDFKNMTSQEYKDALNSCDVVVAPFKDYLHSGSLMHALSARKPIVTPRTPFSESLKNQVGRGWMHLYDGALTSSVLEHAATTSQPASVLDLSVFDQYAVGQQAASFFKSLC